MRKTRFLLILLALCFLLGCSNTVPEGSQPPSANETTEDTAPQIPDETKEQAKKPVTQGSATMMVSLGNSKMTKRISAENNIEVFADPGDVIQADVTIRNGADYDLIVFADGLPVEFTVDGKQYQSYPVDLASQKPYIEITFEKKFDLNLGRLDFVLSFAGDPQGTYHARSYTVYVALDTEAVQPAALYETVEQRESLQGSLPDGTYNSWLWNETAPPTEMHNAGPRKISFQEGETAILEAIAGTPGLYRTVLVLNGDPVSFTSNGEEYFYLDWESTGTNMLQLPVQIENLHLSGSIYTVTTPLNVDPIGQRVHTSWRVELLENGEE